MNYNGIISGEFISRPNRFIAKVYVNGTEETVHVKNTGRCRELLIPGVIVYLEPAQNPNRKTKFSLIAVEKSGRIINMDSQAPNKILHEALIAGMAKGFPRSLTLIKPEYTYKNSRLDFYLESDKSKCLVEVKGVTLEVDDKAYFPDAPTLRGIKHLDHLIDGVKNGYRGVSCYIIQMDGVTQFSPNYATHPQYGEKLKEAVTAGVEVIAYQCKTTSNSIVLDKPIRVIL